MADKKEPVDLRFWQDHSPVVRKIFLARLQPEEAVSVVAAADLVFQWACERDTRNRIGPLDDRPTHRHLRAIIEDLKVCQSYLLHLFEDDDSDEAHLLACCGDTADRLGQLIDILSAQVGPSSGPAFLTH